MLAIFRYLYFQNGWIGCKSRFIDNMCNKNRKKTQQGKCGEKNVT